MSKLLKLSHHSEQRGCIPDWSLRSCFLAHALPGDRSGSGARRGPCWWGGCAGDGAHARYL